MVLFKIKSFFYLKKTQGFFFFMKDDKFGDQKERLFFEKKVKASLDDKDVSFWTATGQILDSWTATGQVLDSWAATGHVQIPTFGPMSLRFGSKASFLM